MAYKYEDTDYWVEQILPIQRQVKPFVTVEQCRRAWKLPNLLGWTEEKAQRFEEELRQLIDRYLEEQ